MRIRSVFVVCALLFCASAMAEVAADAITGVWLSESGEGYVQIFEDNDKFHGHIVGAPPDSPRRNDSGKNLLGTRILDSLSYAGDGHWQDGTVYDPDKDKTYSAELTLKDTNTLKIRGFIGLSLLGRTVTWTRASSDAPGVEQDQLK